MYTQRLAVAFTYALEVHETQTRKGAREVPYIVHLMAVAAHVGDYGGSEDQMIAALLHDAAEDQAVPLEYIKNLFGARVASYVERLSDYIGQRTLDKPEWRPRKEAYIAHLQGESADLKLISVADKLHNAQSTVRDLRANGASAWSAMRDRESTLWYYQSVIGALEFGWQPQHPLLQELRAAVAEMTAYPQPKRAMSLPGNGNAGRAHLGLPVQP